MIPKNAKPEVENWDFIQSEAAKSDDKENDDPNCSTNLVNKNISTSKHCNYCNEILENGKSGKKHDLELCHEASKYINGQTCLICDIEFGATIEVAKHIKKEHLDIIVILELRSEAVKPVVKTEIKQEIQGNLLWGIYNCSDAARSVVLFK